MYYILDIFMLCCSYYLLTQIQTVFGGWAVACALTSNFQECLMCW